MRRLVEIEAFFIIIIKESHKWKKISQIALREGVVVLNKL